MSDARNVLPSVDREAVLERGCDARFVHASHNMVDGQCTSCGMRPKWKGAEDPCGCRWLHERAAFDKTRKRKRRRL